MQSQGSRCRAHAVSTETGFGNRRVRLPEITHRVFGRTPLPKLPSNRYIVLEISDRVRFESCTHEVVRLKALLLGLLLFRIVIVRTEDPEIEVKLST